MTYEELSSLHDVYDTFDVDKKVQKTQYCLQFLWRDLTSDFDIVGPYFTSDENMPYKVLVTCVLDTIRVFQRHGFNVICLVCDGAATNLSLIKLLCGCEPAAYGMSPYPEDDPHEVRPWFINPYNPYLNIYCVICPSHQVIINL